MEADDKHPRWIGPAGWRVGTLVLLGFFVSQAIHAAVDGSWGWTAANVAISCVLAAMAHVHETVLEEFLFDKRSEWRND